MTPSSVLPISGPEEVEAFLRRLPLAVDARRFSELVLGFPRRYLETTPAVEVVRHFALMNSLGSRPLVSSLAPEGSSWRVCVVARDRRFLFTRLAGSLSCFGMNIVSADAFANANALVLDTFLCVDEERYLETPEHRRGLQAFLEGVVGGSIDLEARLAERLPRLALAAGRSLALAWDNRAHPSATRLLVSSEDRLGLLYLLSRELSEAGCNIEMAYVETSGGAVSDAFFLTRDGQKLSEAHQRYVSQRLKALGAANGSPG